MTMADAPRPNLTELMETAKKMQEGMQQAREELKHSTVEGTAGGDMVKITLNGQHECIRVLLSDKAHKESKEILEDLIKAAINAANNEVEKTARSKMLELTKKLGLPPDFNLPEE
jgi:DNA-binding YbaB/EbfC family protein